MAEEKFRDAGEVGFGAEDVEAEEGVDYWVAWDDPFIGLEEVLVRFGRGERRGSTRARRLTVLAPFEAAYSRTSTALDPPPMTATVLSFMSTPSS